MQGRVRQIITTPTNIDSNRVIVANIINVILLTIMMGTLIFLFLLIVLRSDRIYSSPLLPILLSSIVLKALLNRGYFRTVSILMVSLSWLIVTLGAVNTAGIYAPINNAYGIVIVLSSIVFGKRAALYAALLCSLSGLTIVVLMQAGVISIPEKPITPIEVVWMGYSFIYLLAGVLVYLIAQVMERSTLAAQHIAQELQQSTDYLKRAESIAHVGNFEHDIESATVKWSDESYRIFGIEIGTPITLQLYKSLVLDDIYQQIMSNVKQTIETGKSYEIEYPIVLSNGIRREVYTVGNAVFDNKGKVVKIFGIMQDITQRKRAEQIQQVLLNISRSRYETENLYSLFAYVFQQLGGLINVSNCYVALYDEKTELFSFPYGFDAKLKDWSPQKLTGGLTDYVRRTGQSIMLTADDQLGLAAKSELTMLGELAQIWLGAPLKINQRVIGVIGLQDYEDKNMYQQSDLELLTYVAENIASVIDSKRAEDERLELEIQKQNNDFLQEFVGHMTHDLKTPLSVIKNSTYLLANIKEESRQVEYIERINYQLDRLDRMIEDILTIAHLDHIERPSQSMINMNDLLKHVTQQLYPKMQRKNLELDLDLAPALPIIWGSETDLTRAFLNLLENATNYSNENGKITVCTYLVDDNIICEIRDTGIGIKPEDLAHIFDRFYRADNARDFERGTGLGLAIVSRVIELHKGSITVESELGLGTKFTLQLNHYSILQQTSS